MSNEWHRNPATYLYRVSGFCALRIYNRQTSTIPLAKIHWTNKSVLAQKKLFLNAAYLLREMAISSENCGSLRRLPTSGSVVK